jgi:hypothetical protein
VLSMTMTERERAEAWLQLVERRFVPHEPEPDEPSGVQKVAAYVPMASGLFEDIESWHQTCEISAGRAHWEYDFVHDVDPAEMVWQLCHDVLHVEQERRAYKKAARSLERIARRAMGLTKSQWRDFLNHVGP